MAYVPGYRHDVFVSYAHGDDRDWISRLVNSCETALKRRFGIQARIWIDDDSLRKSRDFSTEILDVVKSSAVFLLLTSPTYIRSRYCIDQECKTFDETLAARRARFSTDSFKNERFAFRCPILPVEGNEHWTIFPGLTDIPFCDASDTFATGTPEFESSFRRFAGELADLLKRMRNHSTPVFLYPAHPGPDIQDVYQSLVAELSDNSYRILPDREVNLPDQLRDSSMSVFLLGSTYDEAAGQLAEFAGSRKDKPWVIWNSAGAEKTDSADQKGLCAFLEQLDSPSKTYLNAEILPARLKEEVLRLLQPTRLDLAQRGGKPRIYLLYNSRDAVEMKNAGLISFWFRKEFLFEHPNDPSQHAHRLSQSDGVLLVWGNSGEDWCSREFAEMLQTQGHVGTRGLCLFDPAAPKTDAVRQLRAGFRDLHISEQFGRFDPARLAPFFDPILRRSQGAQG